MSLCNTAGIGLRHVFAYLYNRRDTWTIWFGCLLLYADLLKASSLTIYEYITVIYTVGRQDENDIRLSINFFEAPTKAFGEWLLVSDGGEVSRELLASITHWKLLILKSELTLWLCLFFPLTILFPSLCFFLSFWLTNTSSISTCGFFISFCHIFSLWIHFQLKNIFFFWNAGLKSPSWSSPNWILLLSSWTLFSQLQKGAARLWSVPMFVLVLMWDNSFRELKLLKVINTNTAYLPMHSVTEIRFLEVTGLVLFYIYHASAVEKKSTHCSKL